MPTSLMSDPSPSILDIPELFDMVLSFLSTQDLGRCILVNRQWCNAALPHLCRTIPTLSFKQRQAFGRMLRKHYSQEYSLCPRPGESSHGPQSSACRSSLRRHFLWIRSLNNPHFLFSELNSIASEKAILSFFLKHCVNVVLTLNIDLNSLHRFSHVFKIVTDSLAPNVHELSLQGPQCQGSSLGMCLIWYLYVVSRCSNKLEKLTIQTDWFAGTCGDIPSVELTIADPDLSGLKELVLDCCWDDDELSDWDWLWKKCNNVERLELRTSKYTHLQEMSACIALHLHKVNVLVFKHDRGYMTGQDLASLISACRLGWRSVRTEVSLDRLPCGALESHCATLEEVQMTNISEYSSRTLSRILSSSPRLRVLVTSDDTPHDKRRIPYLDAEHFIDARQGTQNPWACETTLRVLRTKITRIPRPDVTNLSNGQQHTDASKITHMRKGRQVQSRVYERLSRFSSLEELCLGHGTIVRSEPYYPGDAVGEDYQYECLEMNLESGLHQLSGLKELRVLDVRRMAQRIGIKEVQWMVQHWPKLQVVRGLHDDGDNLDAAEWVWKHHPAVQVDISPRSSYSRIVPRKSRKERVKVK